MELLLQWMRKWKIDDLMLWKQAAIEQACFLRDIICEGLLKTKAFVVSNHTSKSILLPVYAFTMRNGIKVICRENFYGWMLTVELPQDKPNADILPEDIFDCGYKQCVHTCYFEGFKNEWVSEGYNPDDLNQRKFSFGIRDNYQFYMAMYFLNKLYADIVYSEEAKTLTKEYVSDMISTIYDSFGYNDFQDNGNCHVARVMNGFEILSETYYKLNDYDFQKKNNIENITWGVDNRIDEFAEYIVTYPETSEAFVREMNMFNTKF